MLRRCEPEDDQYRPLYFFPSFPSFPLYFSFHPFPQMQAAAGNSVEFMAGSRGYHDATDGQHMMGTSIMAVSFDGGVVLGR